MQIRMAILAVATALTTSTALAETPAELTERLLTAGRLGEAEASLTGILKDRPGDDTARFGLGITRFLQAVERLGQSFHRHGLAADGLLMQNLVPFARLPIPRNPHPEPIRYADLRSILQRLVDDLARAEAALAAVGGEAKVPLHLGRIRLDLDGDGQASPDERLWNLYLVLNPGARNDLSAERCEAFAIAFDRGDAAWLRGYCHLLMAMVEAYLAHDGQELFDHSAQLFFLRPVTPFPFLNRPAEAQTPGLEMEIVDAIAMVHMLRLPVLEPGRMRAALGHLEAMIAMSRESWKFILAETDNDNEWIPNPRQFSVLPGGRVSDEMLRAWISFLDETEAILKGKLLIPFWRAGEERGVNLRRVFTEPRTFDLVLWIQGTAAVPYLEKGPLTKAATWRRLQNVFHGEFIGFAFWFN